MSDKVIKQNAARKLRHKPGCLSHRVVVSLKAQRSGHRDAYAICQACKANQIIEL